MAYTAPTNFVAGNVLTAAQLNTRMLDNIRALKDPPRDANRFTSDVSTTSATFVDLTGSSKTIIIAGDRAKLHFEGSFSVSAASLVVFDVLVDGVSQSTNTGVMRWQGTIPTRLPMSFTHEITGIIAGSREFKIQWKIDGGNTVTLEAGESDALMWVQEF